MQTRVWLGQHPQNMLQKDHIFAIRTHKRVNLDNHTQNQ